MKYSTLFLAFLAFFSSTKRLHAQLPEKPTIKAIVFDLDGVLLTTNTTKATRKLGIFNVLHYIIATQSTPSKAALFKALYPIPGISTAYSEHEGKPMPQIMLDWQTGLQTNEQLLALCLEHFNKQYAAGTICSAQMNVFKGMVNLMFDTNIYIESKISIFLNIQALQTIAEYAKKHDIKLLILSNWDKESLPLVKEKFPEIFSHFQDDHIIISGNTGLVKPHADMFAYLLSKHNLEAKDCVFIDDEAVNIQAAEKLGFATIHCTPHVSKNLLLPLEKLI